ncbi:unnamed protein product [Mytilus edulis]|uniref:Ig-like domain-containing protein n=1 Tax=Mytilus edulis TaxID=6550 RepID=A0A8S3QRF1_MYTED|nr:unnamed protein product [Mytilus edulis]
MKVTLIVNSKNFKMKIYFLLICMMHRTSANVEWKLKESQIKIGKSLNLECTASPNTMQNVSRRWTGGVKNRLLCFNGVTTNPQKYIETSESASRYILQIKETSEDDLDCPYSCRFGFQSDEKILYVTEDNFNYLPDQNTTEIEYSLNNENYTLHLEFKKVFPEPVCKIQIKDTIRNLTKVKGSKERIFYHITYQMESRESLHACGSDLKIKCTIGKQLHDINFTNDLSCTALDVIKSTISDIQIAGIVLGLFVTVVICFLAYFTYSKKIIPQKRDQGKTYKTANTTKENCHPEL